MSATGANLEESLFRLVANDHYKDFPDYRYLSKQDDTRILEQGHALVHGYQHPGGRSVPCSRKGSSCQCGSRPHAQESGASGILKALLEYKSEPALAKALLPQLAI